jgi:hypothetical protein
MKIHKIPCPECGETKYKFSIKEGAYCAGCGIEIEYGNDIIDSHGGPTGHGDICFSDADSGL